MTLTIPKEGNLHCMNSKTKPLNFGVVEQPETLMMVDVEVVVETLHLRENLVRSAHDSNLHVEVPSVGQLDL